MTALVLNTIPSAINSYERLLCWAAQAMQNASSGQSVKVVDNQPNIPTVQVSVGVIADGTARFIVQAYIPVDLAGLNSATAKTWMAANDVVTATPNVVFGSN